MEQTQASTKPAIHVAKKQVKMKDVLNKDIIFFQKLVEVVSDGVLLDLDEFPDFCLDHKDPETQ